MLIYRNQKQHLRKSNWFAKNYFIRISDTEQGINFFRTAIFKVFSVATCSNKITIFCKIKTFGYFLPGVLNSIFFFKPLTLIVQNWKAFHFFFCKAFLLLVNITSPFLSMNQRFKLSYSHFYFLSFLSFLFVKHLFT